MVGIAQSLADVEKLFSDQDFEPSVIFIDDIEDQGRGIAEYITNMSTETTIVSLTPKPTDWANYNISKDEIVSNKEGFIQFLTRL